MSGKIILDDQKKLILKANNKILIQKYLLVNKFFTVLEFYPPSMFKFFNEEMC